ncbi:MAG: hypothetical protein FWD17_04685 [Polyangiaceae bacterium]|nr:hypothetical protein [Polyangiaceae bacterium]
MHRGLVSALVAGGLWVISASGCAVDATNEPSKGDPATSQETQDLSLGGLLGGVTGLLGGAVCLPLTCCLQSTGGGWTPNDFENALKSLGCTEPKAYTPSFGKADWFKYSKCPDLTLVPGTVTSLENLGQPYSASVLGLNASAGVTAITDLCLLAQTTLQLKYLVTWDPFCPTCYYRYQSSYFSIDPAIAQEIAAQTGQ